MAKPRLEDDGRAVTLDLHGASVNDAGRVIVRVAQLAAGLGRDRLRIVHGSSSSDPLGPGRTIRQCLYDLLESGQLRTWVTDAVRFEDAALLSLTGAGRASTTRLTNADLYAALR